MTRIFSILAGFAVCFMATNLILGLAMGDIRHEPAPETVVWKRIHVLTGVAVALVVVFVNSIAVTYFIGTSRWCKEVVEAYRLDPALLRRSTSLKRRTFPWAVAAMLSVVGIVALGGAADPATFQKNTEAWATPHLMAAMAGLAFIGWAFFIQWNNIHANHAVITDILAEVHRIRAERGLDE